MYFSDFLTKPGMHHWVWSIYAVMNIGIIRQICFSVDPLRSQRQKSVILLSRTLAYDPTECIPFVLLPVNHLAHVGG